jgi:hypothetical protein
MNLFGQMNLPRTTVNYAQNVGIVDILHLVKCELMIFYTPKYSLT